jgi:cell division protein FtsI/penicillin-binding protein 2
VEIKGAGFLFLLLLTATIVFARSTETEKYHWQLYDVASGKMVAEESSLSANSNLEESIFHPGSTLKPFLLSSAIAGGWDPQRSIECQKNAIETPRHRRCWLAQGHGLIDLPHALAHSCSIYTRAACRAVDADRYRQLLLSLGFQTGIPEPDPFRAMGCEGWMGAEPGIAVTIAELANAYRLAFGKLADKPTNPPRLVGLESLRQGLKDCCLYGTGKEVREHSPMLSIIGKTGTGFGTNGDPIGVFVGLTSAEQPRQLIVTVIQNSTGHDAARLAGEILLKNTQNPK